VGNVHSASAQSPEAAEIHVCTALRSKTSPIRCGGTATASRPAFVRDHSYRSAAKMADRVLAMNRGSTGQR
jgi:hypothetical protein